MNGQSYYAQKEKWKGKSFIKPTVKAAYVVPLDYGTLWLVAAIWRHPVF